jgi:hypothetical protein
MGNDEVFNGITRILANSPSRGKLATIVSDNPAECQGEIKRIAEIPDINNNHLVFTEEFIKDEDYMRRREEIVNYVHSKGYTTNLD